MMSSSISFDPPRQDRPWHRSVQCTSVNRHGERCGHAAITGGNVCHLHGGSSPDVIATARRRLLAMVEPAFDVLDRATRSAPKCDHCGRSDSDRDPVALAAAKTILDRAGFGKHSKLTIEHETTGPSAIEWLTHAEKVQMLTLFAAAKMRMRSGQPPTSATVDATAIEGQVISKEPVQSNAPRADDDVVHERDPRPEQRQGRSSDRDLTPEQVERLKKKIEKQQVKVAKLAAAVAAEEAHQLSAAERAAAAVVEESAHAGEAGQ